MLSWYSFDMFTTTDPLLPLPLILVTFSSRSGGFLRILFVDIDDTFFPESDT